MRALAKWFYVLAVALIMSWLMMRRAHGVVSTAVVALAWGTLVWVVYRPRGWWWRLPTVTTVFALGYVIWTGLLSAPARAGMIDWLFVIFLLGNLVWPITWWLARRRKQRAGKTTSA
jgi:hypothetical protein